MEESNPEFKSFFTAKISKTENKWFFSPGVTKNQIFPSEAHIAESSSVPNVLHPKLLCKVGRISQESALHGHTAQEWRDDKEDKPYLGRAGPECCCWNCVANRHRTTEPGNRETAG